MPLYDYSCKECGKKDIDILEGVNDKLRRCSKCGATMFREYPLCSPPVFHGSGFYCNDYPKGERK